MTLHCSDLAARAAPLDPDLASLLQYVYFVKLNRVNEVALYAWERERVGGDAAAK